MEELIRSWNLKNHDDILEMIQENNLTVEHLKWIDEKDTCILVEKLPMAARIEFKRELFLWKDEVAWDSRAPMPIRNSNLQQPLENILKRCQKGRDLLKLADKGKILSGDNQSTLTHIISQEYLNEGITMKNEDCFYFSEEIVRIFPSEDKNVYFRVVNGKPMGKLYYRCKNQRFKRKDTEIEESNKNVGANNISDDNLTANLAKSPEVQIEDLSESETKKCWLKHHRDPWEEVIKAWKLTHLMRARDLKELTTSELFRQWPLLSHGHAHHLIDVDFEMIHPGKSNALLSKWENETVTILSLMEEEIKDSDSLKILDILRKKTNLSEDKKNLMIIKVLHALLKPAFITTAKGKRRKPSIRDSQNAMLLELERISDLDREIDQLHSDAKALNETVQPFIIVDKELEHFLVYYDGSFYKGNSVLNIIDLNFKIFHVFNTKFPASCVKVWTFFQIFFYDIRDEGPHAVEINSLVKRLRAKN